MLEWQYEVWSNTHTTRPGPAGNLAPAWHLEPPFAPPPPKPLPLPAGGGNRNAIPLYTFPNARVVHHFVPAMPLRVSALRALGAYHNVFAIESFMDELAAAASADPVEFRLRHLDDLRARDVVAPAPSASAGAASSARAAAAAASPSRATRTSPAYCAVAIEVEVRARKRPDPAAARGRRRSTAAKPSTRTASATRPKAASSSRCRWTLYEAVRFDTTRITSRDWSTYPILRFSTVPDGIDVHVIDRPGKPFLGTGEAAQGPAARGARECRRRRDRRAHPRAAAHAAARESGGRRLSVAGRAVPGQGGIASFRRRLHRRLTESRFHAGSCQRWNAPSSARVARLPLGAEAVEPHHLEAALVAAFAARFARDQHLLAARHPAGELGDSRCRARSPPAAAR